ARKSEDRDVMRHPQNRLRSPRRADHRSPLSRPPSFECRTPVTSAASGRAFWSRLKERHICSRIDASWPVAIAATLWGCRSDCGTFVPWKYEHYWLVAYEENGYVAGAALVITAANDSEAIAQAEALHVTLGMTIAAGPRKWTISFMSQLKVPRYCC